MPRLSDLPVLKGQNNQNNIDLVRIIFLITPLQQITLDLTQSWNASYLSRHSDQVTSWKNEESGCIPGRNCAFI